jgi:hypothetical protein
LPAVLLCQTEVRKLGFIAVGQSGRRLAALTAAEDKLLATTPADNLPALLAGDYALVHITGCQQPAAEWHG